MHTLFTVATIYRDTALETSDTNTAIQVKICEEAEVTDNEG